MNLLEDSSNEYNYQFPRWPSSLSRPHSSSPSKNFLNDISKLGIDNRNQIPRPDSSSSIKRTIKHHIHIPTGSPPSVNPPLSTPDGTPKLLHSSPIINKSGLYHTLPVRIKSTSLSIPSTKTKETILQNFPKQTHEQRKITHERKRKKQQAQVLADKYAENETWFQLKRSLSELKRIALTQNILVDPSTTLFNCDEHSITIDVTEKNEEIIKIESNDIENRFNQPSCESVDFNTIIEIISSFFFFY